MNTNQPLLDRAAAWLAAPEGETPESTRELIRDLRAFVFKNTWTPLAEQVPDYEVEVLTTDGTYRNVGERVGTKKSGEIFKLCGEEGADSEDLRTTLTVTHWMPLPELPEKKS